MHKDCMVTPRSGKPEEASGFLHLPPCALAQFSVALQGYLSLIAYY